MSHKAYPAYKLFAVLWPEEIDAELKQLEVEIAHLLKEVSG